jgi:hypothetical protein
MKKIDTDGIHLITDTIKPTVPVITEEPPNPNKVIEQT